MFVGKGVPYRLVTVFPAKAIETKESLVTFLSCRQEPRNSLVKSIVLLQIPTKNLMEDKTKQGSMDSNDASTGEAYCVAEVTIPVALPRYRREDPVADTQSTPQLHS